MDAAQVVAQCFEGNEGVCECGRIVLGDDLLDPFLGDRDRVIEGRQEVIV